MEAVKILVQEQPGRGNRFIAVLEKIHSSHYEGSSVAEAIGKLILKNEGKFNCDIEVTLIED